MDPVLMAGISAGLAEGYNEYLKSQRSEQDRVFQQELLRRKLALEEEQARAERARAEAEQSYRQRDLELRERLARQQELEQAQASVNWSKLTPETQAALYKQGVNWSSQAPSDALRQFYTATSPRDNYQTLTEYRQTALPEAQQPPEVVEAMRAQAPILPTATTLRPAIYPWERPAVEPPSTGPVSFPVLPELAPSMQSGYDQMAAAQQSTILPRYKTEAIARRVNQPLPPAVKVDYTDLEQKQIEFLRRQAMAQYKEYLDATSEKNAGKLRYEDLVSQYQSLRQMFYELGMDPGTIPPPSEGVGPMAASALELNKKRLASYDAIINKAEADAKFKTENTKLLDDRLKLDARRVAALEADVRTRRGMLAVARDRAQTYKELVTGGSVSDVLKQSSWLAVRNKLEALKAAAAASPSEFESTADQKTFIDIHSDTIAQMDALHYMGESGIAQLGALVTAAKQQRKPAAWIEQQIADNLLKAAKIPSKESRRRLTEYFMTNF